MGDYLETLVREKQAKVVYHMASFLGQESVRASNAANCAVEEGRFIEFHQALYDVQASENSGIFSNKNLVEIGKRLGITSPSFESCVNDNKFGDTVKKVGESMAKNNVQGTPTVFINGKLWNRSGSDFVLDEFKAAVVHLLFIFTHSASLQALLPRSLSGTSDTSQWAALVALSAMLRC